MFIGSTVFLLSVGVLQTPTPLKPTTGQVNVSEHPTFSWEDSNPNTTIYDVAISTENDCTHPTRVDTTSAGVKTFPLPNGVNLETGRTLYFCLRARDGNPANTSPYSAPRPFTTRRSVVATPTLSIAARSSAQQPNGQRQIFIEGVNGEEGATARFYLKTGAADIDMGSVSIDGNSRGAFSILVDVRTQSTAAGPRNYYAVIERSAGVISQASSLTTFYYDPKYSLATPELQKGTANGELKWKAIESATSTQYEIYRRVGLQGCTPSDSVSCYFNKPFTRITCSTPTLSSDRLLHSICPIENNANGVSYFIVATQSSGSTSNRSNSVSFFDAVAPQLHSEVVKVSASNTGRSVFVYYCNVDGNGFLNSDNSPDLTAKVKYFRRSLNEGCGLSDTEYSSRSQDANLLGGQEDLGFDALITQTDRSANIDNCVFAGEIEDLNPDTPYCFQVCQQDTTGSGLTETTCSNADQRTLPDLVAPDFVGLVGANALPDGRSIQVQWILAAQDQQTREVIQYQVQRTSQLDATGLPIFKNILEDNAVSLINGGTNSATIDNLLTGTKYCFLASALDDYKNRNTPPDRYQCATTYDNRPSVQEIHLGEADIHEPYKVSIQFKVVDREANLQTHHVLLESIHYRLGQGEWHQIKSEHLSGNDQLTAGTSINSATVNTYVFNTLPYFSGEQEIEFKIQVKDYLSAADLSGNAITDPITNASEAQSNPTTIFAGRSNSAAFENTSLSGCELNAQLDAPFNVWLITLMLFAITLILFQRKAESAPKIRHPR